MVELCLGGKLDKSEQFSNWENRPLRTTQLVYASIDAYCLIEVYDILQEQCRKQNIPFDDICNKLMHDIKIKKKTKKNPSIKTAKSKVVNQQPVNEADTSMPLHTVKTIRFVCDTMVQGLGKSLRQCGIDTIILNSYTHHDECVKIANKENRYILTRGTVYHKVCYL